QQSSLLVSRVNRGDREHALLVRLVLGVVVELENLVVELVGREGHVVNGGVRDNRPQGLGLPSTSRLGVTTVKAELRPRLAGRVAQVVHAGVVGAVRVCCTPRRW